MENKNCETLLENFERLSLDFTIFGEQSWKITNSAKIKMPITSDIFD